MSSISLVGVNLAVVVLESLLYGLYFVLALHTLYLMVIRRRERRSTRASGFPGHIQSRSRSGFLSPVAIGAFSLFITVTSVRIPSTLGSECSGTHFLSALATKRY